ncbi:MAG: glycosyltransferase family 2 protein [Wujia sp.]
MEQSRNLIEKPYISVVLICYNYAHLLPKALEGIAKQTFKNFELVFVDNGCSDNSVEIFENFVEEHPDLSYQLVTIPENIGVAHGDNMGSAAARGKYILFHDADDWMDDDTLKLLAKAAKAKDADRVIAAFRDVDQNGKVIQEQTIAKNPEKWLYGMQQANLFRTSIYHEKVKEVHDCLWIDAEKTLRFSQFAKNIAYVHRPCYNYLVHTDSTSRNKKIYQQIWTDRYSLEKFLSFCKAVYDDEENEEDRLWIMYQSTKLYYSYIYQFLRDAPLKDKWKSYDKLREVMKKTFPGYLKNKKASIFRKGGNRFYANMIASVSVLLEKTHLMKLGLLAYHLISKIHYFSV